MKKQFSHTLASSFVEWFDHTLLKEGEAFSNYGGKFYNMGDAKLAGYSVYALPFGQLVADASISGAAIPSGVYVNGTFVGRGTSGLKLDFQRGRAIFSGGYNNLNVSGNVAIKEFDVVFSVLPEDKLLISSKFSVKPKFTMPQTGLAAGEYQFPAVFLTSLKSEDEPFELGHRADHNISHFRALVMAENEWQLMGVESIFTAKKHSYLPLLSNTPFDYFGDLKGGSYNFETLQNAVSADHLVFVEEASFTRFSSRANAAINPLVYMGVIEFTLAVRRI